MSRGHDVDAKREPGQQPLTAEEIANMTPQQILDRAEYDPDIARRLPGTEAPAAGSADQGAIGPDRSHKSSRQQLLDGKSTRSETCCAPVSSTRYSAAR